MELVYAQEAFPRSIVKSIFLAGPTPRNDEIESWRKDALSLLEKYNYNGIVYIPETREKAYYDNYDHQFEWEHQALDRADIILFWIPRSMKLDSNNNPILAGLTTNIEFGLYANSNKIVVGFPSNADNIVYIEKCCLELNIPYFNTLESTILTTLNILGEGAYRQEEECQVPLLIWKNKEFQNWYSAQLNQGNRLLNFKCNYSFVMPKLRKLFLWICSAEVFIAAENRIKANEFVLSRTDVYSVVLYYKDDINTYVILIKEFRTPCCNSECFVYELPGGSSTVEEIAENIAINEIKEETGIELDKNRLQIVDSKQAIATLSAHKIHAYKILLTKDEFESIKKLQNTVHGVEEDTEKTYLTIKTVNEILSSNLIDWSNLGIILSAIS